MSKKVKKRLVIAAVFVILCGLSAWGFALKPVNYSFSTEKLDKGMRIVFISDLHNCFYGNTDNSKLIDEVHKAEPDMVVFGGDVIDMWGGTEYALNLMSALSAEYPCVYTPGNHEGMRDDTEEFYEKVRSICPVLMGDMKEFSINGQDIRFYGVVDSVQWGKKKNQLEECIDELDDKYYNILLLHQPEQIDDCFGSDGKGFDLVLSGHAHGGQWRLPKILEQGLYAPDQGIFPKYTTGIYHIDDTTHIISRGLARPMRMIFIPRIFNRPELSIIDINN